MSDKIKPRQQKFPKKFTREFSKSNGPSRPKKDKRQNNPNRQINWDRD